MIVFSGEGIERRSIGWRRHYVRELGKMGGGDSRTRLVVRMHNNMLKGHPK